MKRHGLLILSVIALCMAIAVPFTLLQAQTPQELLTNNGMESYYGLGGDKVVPLGWTLTSSIPINTAKQQWQFENQQYVGSWHLSTQSVAFSATAYQFVPGVPSGTPLRFSVEANIFTCDNNTTSCIGSDGRRTSNTGSNARIRVGIDPTGGKDGSAASVVWSTFAQPWDAFRQLVIDSRTTTANGVTVFINYTQDYAMFLNDVYLDNASLQVLGPGVVIGGTTTGGTAAPPPPVFAPFVTPQPTQTDGSIVHIVREGDTLSSIAVAYNVTVAQIRELNKLPVGAFLMPGQKLIIRKGAAPVYLIVTATPEGTLSEVTQSPTPAIQQTSPSGRPTFGPVLIPTRTPTQSAAIPKARARLIEAFPARVFEVSDTGSVCLITFNDLNSNAFQDAGESAVGSVAFTISQNAQSVREIATSNIRPACAEDLSAGLYEIAANLPSEARLTLGNPVEVDLKAGVELTITAGITAYNATQADPSTNAVVELLISSVIDHSGVIVLASAGLILIGAVAAALLRR